MSDTRVPEGNRLSEAQRFDWLRLWRSESVGPRSFRALINRFGSAKAALDALPSVARRPLRIPSQAEIEREFEQALRLGATFVALGEPEYPPLLRRIDSAPAVIALRGAPAIFGRPALAIVGARNASAAGLAFAERLAKGVAQHGYAVVSGLARGIDIRAHRATQETGTIVVLAGGHDRVYPPEFAPLLEHFLEQGAVISEMPFGWEARGRDFPRRNRIVAGLAQGTVVVEAARRSGSLITARFAAEQGREVFAVPGSPLDPRAEGTNDLLRDGATLCTRVEDVIEALAKQLGGEVPPQDLFSEAAATDPGDEPLWDELELAEVEPAPSAPAMPSGPPLNSNHPVGSATNFAPEMRVPASAAEAKERIIGLLGPSPISIDELVRSSAAPAREVRSVLLELELAGRLERHGGDLVSLI
jgi:DNA processing protein